MWLSHAIENFDSRTDGHVLETHPLVIEANLLSFSLFAGMEKFSGPTRKAKIHETLPLKKICKLSVNLVSTLYGDDFIDYQIES